MRDVKSQPNKYIIIYDYDRYHTDALINELNKIGFEIAVVNGAPQLIRQVQLTQPCAVVMEISPAQGASPDLVRSLRDEGFTGPVIAISYRVRKSDFNPCDEAQDAGADMFLFKPVDGHVLCGILDDLTAVQAGDRPFVPDFEMPPATWRHRKAVRGR